MDPIHRPFGSPSSHELPTASTWSTRNGRSGVPGSEPSHCNCHECEQLSARSDLSGESAAQQRNDTGLGLDLRCSHVEVRSPSADARDYQRRSPDGSAFTSEGVRERLSVSSFRLSDEQNVGSVTTNIVALASDETNLKTIYDKTCIKPVEICCSKLTLDDSFERLNVVCEKGNHGLQLSPNICDICKQSRLRLINSEKQPYQLKSGVNFNNIKPEKHGVARRKSTQVDFKSNRKSWPPRSLDIQPKILVDSEKSSSDKSSLSSTRFIYSRQRDQESSLESSSGSSNCSRVFQNNLDIDEHDQDNDELYLRDRQIHSPGINLQQSDTSTNDKPPSGPLSNLVANAVEAKRKKVFVTYSWNANEDDVGFLKEVRRLCNSIERTGAVIRIDLDAEKFASRGLNRLDWLDKQHNTADWILVCISPTYTADIKPDNNAAANPRESQLNARYIFDKIRLEYHKNNSRNRRAIPVLFSNFGTTQKHVPDCMSTTIPFQFPAHENEIVQSIFNHAVPFRDE